MISALMFALLVLFLSFPFTAGKPEEAITQRAYHCGPYPIADCLENSSMEAGLLDPGAHPDRLPARNLGKSFRCDERKALLPA